MSSIQDLLNPEAAIPNSRERAPAVRKWEPISSESTSDTNTNPTILSKSQLPEASQDGDHEPHPNCPDALACLPDTDGRPQHTLPVILRCAILGSAKKRLTIREIYAAMEDKYAYFRNAGPTWKQSVRHHLSLNRLFERQPRPATDPGFGSYWTVNLSAPPGTKRPRKRGRTSKTVSSCPSTIDSTQSNQQKKRGRPRKSLQLSESFASPPPITPGTASSIRTFDRDSEGSAERKDSSQECNVTEDEYESEEDMVIPRSYDPSSSGLDVLGIRQAATRLYGSDKGNRVFSNTDEVVIDRMQIEMAGLRRQAADAISVSLRISDQLAEAQAETARVKATLRATERLLEDEGRKRREAERIASEESRMRRAAEEIVYQPRNQPAACDSDLGS